MLTKQDLDRSLILNADIVYNWIFFLFLFSCYFNHILTYYYSYIMFC